MALEELKSGFSILKQPQSSKKTSTEMETRKLLSFPSGEDSQAAADAKDSLDFDTKLSLRCYIPPEADKNQPMECLAKGVSSQSSKEDLDVSSLDMLQLRLGEMSRTELDNSMESQRNSKAAVSSGNKLEELSLVPKQLQDTQRMMVIWNQPNKVCSSSQQMKDDDEKGTGAIDDEKDDAAAENANMELDEYIQNTVIRGTSSPPSKMLRLTLPIPELSVGPEPGTIWIKRLKLSASDMSGSKISSIQELLPHEKKVQNLHRSELVVLDEDEKEAPPKKASDQLALCPWMRRWCRQKKAPEKSKPVCNPNSKPAIPEIPEKQFPSIAAMALMGGFQPGVYKKKGSVTVWNDGGY